MPALMILAASLKRFSPNASLHLPARDLSQETLSWFAQTGNVVLHKDIWAEDTFWNIKPFLLEEMLSKGIERITWLDADLLVTSNTDCFFDVPDDTLVVAQEGFRSRGSGTSERTGAIGHHIGRELGYTVNSCIVSVTRYHKDLLAEWKNLLRSETYNGPDAKNILVGDQDILGGLVGSTMFSDVKIAHIQTGSDIAHDMLPGDFSALERIRTIWQGEPRFVHSQGRKTWRTQEYPAKEKKAINQLALHRQWSKEFIQDIPSADRNWLDDDTLLTRIMIVLFPRKPSLRGIPLGILGSVLNCLYRVRNFFRR